MIILVSIISIGAITGLIWQTNKIFNINICPICAGVSSTWIWMIIARFVGYPIDPIAPAILMGGSIVGITHQLEKYIASPSYALAWKSGFIPIGFATVYSMIESRWYEFLILFVILLLFGIYAYRSSKRPQSHDDANIRELEQKMKRCC